jgi:hypothetical protein
MMTLATLVMAGDDDSTGNGSSGAFGNGSGSGARAAAAEALAPPARRVAELSPNDAFRVTTSAAGGGGTTTAGGSGGSAAGCGAGLACFGLRGLSHFSQRIPRVIAAPHMKHFEAMKRSSD